MHSLASSKPADRLISVAAAVIGCLFVIWVFSIATFDGPAALGFVLAVCAWVASPYILFALSSLFLCSWWVSRLVLVLGVIGSAAFGLWSFSFVDEDAQGALVLLFAPVYQLVGAVLFVAVVAGIETTKPFLSRRHG